jgi:hypothetical protein
LLEFSIQVAGASESAASSKFQTAGFLVAAGDSWFDYPFNDVLKLLEDNYGYNVESAAHRGEPIETMAYQGGQLDKFARCLEKISAQRRFCCLAVAMTSRVVSSACFSITRRLPSRME